MKYMIAMDSGGTKTDTVLFDETGHILARTITPGANAMDVGLDTATDRIQIAMQDMCARLPKGTFPAAIYGGIAAVDYYEKAMEVKLNERLPHLPLRLEDDGPCMISGTLGHRDGCCIVGGTGASLFARIQDKLHHIGGWGYLLDAAGSGYWLGKEALLAVMRQADGRGPATLLSSLIGQEMGLEPWRNIPGIYAGGRPYIASFAHTIFQARRAGDPAATEIYDRGIHALAELTFAADRYFTDCYDVVLGGGLFAHFPEYTESLQASASPKARLICAQTPPVYGSAVEAMFDADVEVTDAFHARFMDEYEKAGK